MADKRLRRRAARYDHAVDMWSLGVLLYILLVGFHPFDPTGTATEEQMLSNMQARPPPDLHLSSV